MSKILPKDLRKWVSYNPYNFASYCLRSAFVYPTPEFHFEIYRLLKELRLAVAAPRSFAKSTIVSFIYPLWLALTEEKKNILIISATYTLAEDWLRKIKFEIENNHRLIGLFGDQVGVKKWTESHIVLKNGNIIRAQGRGCQIRGYRPTNVIIDDIEDDESVRSKDQRDKLEDWFWKALINTLEKECQIIMIGTLLSPLALLVKILEKPEWTTKTFKAIEGGKSIWPEKWPLRALLKRKKEIGSIAFESEFQNNPMASEYTVFRPEWFKWFEKDKSESEMFIVTTLDPAISEKETADFTAINTMGWHKKRKKIFNLENKAGRWTLMQIADEFFKTYKRWYPDVMWVEQIGYQQVLRQYFDEEMKRRSIDLPIRELVLGRGLEDWKNEKARDKVSRARRISYLVEQGKVYLKHDQKALYDELITFPFGDYDDRVDAFVYGLLVIKQLQDKGELLVDEFRQIDQDAQPAVKIKDGYVSEEEMLWSPPRKDWRYL